MVEEYVINVFVFVLFNVALECGVSGVSPTDTLFLLGLHADVDLVGTGAAFYTYWHVVSSLSFFIFAAVHVVLRFVHAD